MGRLEALCDRLLEVCKADDTKADYASDYRFGHLPSPHLAEHLPLVYVTPAARPEVRRQAFGPRRGDSIPPQTITYEIYVTILEKGPTPGDVQRRLGDRADRLEDAIARNLSLKPPGGGARLCASLRIVRQGRIVRMEGKILEGMVLRVTAIVGYAP